MYSVISTIIWEIFSMLIIFFMVKETNLRISKADLSENLVHISPYRVSVVNIVLLLFVIVVSVICAYLVSQSVVSVWFCMEMGLCYTMLLGAAVVDLKLKEIPNILSVCLIAIGALLLLLQSFFIEQPIVYLLNSALGCFLPFVMLMIAGKISKGGIGMGDIKLLCAIGLTAGLRVVLYTLIIALLYCAVFMAVLKFILFFVSKDNNKTYKNLPFAPFLYFGFLTMIFMKLY